MGDCVLRYSVGCVVVLRVACVVFSVVMACFMVHMLCLLHGVWYCCASAFLWFSEYWCSCGVVCCAEFSVCGGLPGWASLGGVLCDICI